jgi:hypothetical protein
MSFVNTPPPPLDDLRRTDDMRANMDWITTRSKKRLFDNEQANSTKLQKREIK